MSTFSDNQSLQRFHSTCFKCHVCSNTLADEVYIEYSSKPYCEPCHKSHFSTKCDVCHEPILEKIASSGDKSYHFDCFVCTVCKKSLGKEFVDHEGKGRLFLLYVYL